MLMEVLMRSLPKPLPANSDETYAQFAARILAQMSSIGPAGTYSSGPIGDDEVKLKSDQRFRSFAERWVTARCHLFRADYLQQDTWECVQQAKTAYKMIHLVGTSPDIE